MPEQRGGGDLDTDEEGFVGDLKKAAGVSYADIAQRTIGRWSGDRIALIGDYAEKGDLKPKDNADLVYELCASDEDRLKQVAHLKKLVKKTGQQEYAKKATRLARAQLYKDISDDVCQVIEHELKGKFVGDGWREFEYDD